MRVLDLFCGLTGWSQPFLDHGHEVVSLDIEEKFDPTFVVDVREWDGRIPRVDLILASPPCQAFSTMSMGKNWDNSSGYFVPKHARSELGMELLTETFRLVSFLMPRFFVIENPRGVMRKVIEEREPWVHCDTVWYCHYGEDRAKPTDLFSYKLPWKPRPVCHNQRVNHPTGCCCQDHISAPRGSRTGTQGGLSAEESARIPYELADSIRIAVEEVFL